MEVRCGNLSKSAVKTSKGINYQFIENTIKTKFKRKIKLKIKQDSSYQGEALNVPTAS